MFEDDYNLLSRCLKKDREAENQFYLRFAPKMYGICIRYGGNETEASEILQNAFMRLFDNLHQFRFEGSLELWVQCIFVNTAINYYKKQLKYNQKFELRTVEEEATLTEDALSVISTQEMLTMIQRLPVGYRTIFNMYVIEGYDHKEIGNLLGISEGTSKSQLHHAKSSVRRMLKEKGN